MLAFGPSRVCSNTLTLTLIPLSLSFFPSYPDLRFILIISPFSPSIILSLTHLTPRPPRPAPHPHGLRLYRPPPAQGLPTHRLHRSAWAGCAPGSALLVHVLHVKPSCSCLCLCMRRLWKLAACVSACAPPGVLARQQQQSL